MTFALSESSMGLAGRHDSLEPETSRASGPVFVVGAFRSGTSLLHSLLNQHPDLALLYECDVLKAWPLVRAGAVHRGWRERLEFWNAVVSRHRLDRNESGALPGSRREAAWVFYEEYARSENSRIGGEKSPSYVDSLMQLADDFPNARVIVLWRHPKEICRSVRRAARTDPFFRKRGLVTRFLAQFGALQRDVTRLQRRGFRVIQLDYEELVERPVPTLRGLWRFLELASLSGAGRVYAPQVSTLPVGLHPHHAKVRSGVVARASYAGDALPARLSRKLDRYIAYWVERYPETEFAHGLPDRQDLGRAARWTERLRDRCLYRCLHSYDACVRVLYAYLPLNLLRRYRSLRRRRWRAAASG